MFLCVWMALLCRGGHAFLLSVSPPTVSGRVCSAGIDVGQVDVRARLLLPVAASALQMKKGGKHRSSLWDDFDSDAKYKLDKKESGAREVEGATSLMKKRENAQNSAQELREKLDRVELEMARNHNEAQSLMQEVQKDIEIQRMLRKESTEVMERMVDLKKTHMYQLNQARQHYADDRHTLCELHTQELRHSNELLREQGIQLVELQQILKTCQDELASKSQQFDDDEQELSSVRSLTRQIFSLMKARVRGSCQKLFKKQEQ